LSPESHGNGTGCGIADLVTERMLAGIDPIPFRMNNLTACFLWRSKLPFAFPDDRACITAGLETCWQPNIRQVRMAIIPNSLEVAELWLSPVLAEEANRLPHLEVTGAARPLPFDSEGSLLQGVLFPHSVRGKRETAKVA